MPPRLAKLAHLADSTGGFSSWQVNGNVPVTIFPQKDFICER
jgi:hypothetical protein